MTYPRYFIERPEFQAGGDIIYWKLDSDGGITSYWDGARGGTRSYDYSFEEFFEGLIEIQPSELALMI